VGRPFWVKVEQLKAIRGTAFPDINGMKLKGENFYRPAEVKFTTSLFDYHFLAKYKEKISEFTKEKGFILVASHDYLPNHLLTAIPQIDVFEIEIEDFIAFCRENFARLLNKQIKAHTITRVWLMYQGPNFNEGKDRIKPARASYIWCPTENLTSFDLAIGDRILFYKTAGVSTQELQKKFKQNGIIDERWLLKEIYIAEVISNILSRSEYHHYKKHVKEQHLWINDPTSSKNWRWNRVFEFKKVKAIDCNKAMSELFENKVSKDFVVKAWEAYCFGKSREMSLKDYRNLLEVLI
jgi:hypothetical protein